MFYEVEVRPGPNSEFFQYYTETIEAPTSYDAEARVRRANPGCIVRTTKSWDNYHNDEGSSFNSDELNVGGLVFVALIAILIVAWKYLLVFGMIGLGIWFLFKN